MTDRIKKLALEYSQLWDECVLADNARYESDCYGDLPKDRGPHVLGRSEKGLAADKAYKDLSQRKVVTAQKLKSLIEKQVGIDTWKIRCLFV